MNTELKELIERAVNAWFLSKTTMRMIWDNLDFRAHDELEEEIGDDAYSNIDIQVYHSENIEELFPECKFTWDPHCKKWMLVTYNGQSV